MNNFNYIFLILFCITSFTSAFPSPKINYENLDKYTLNCINHGNKLVSIGNWTILGGTLLGFTLGYKLAPTILKKFSKTSYFKNLSSTKQQSASKMIVWGSRIVGAATGTLFTFALSNVLFNMFYKGPIVKKSLSNMFYKQPKSVVKKVFRQTGG